MLIWFGCFTWDFGLCGFGVVKLVLVVVVINVVFEFVGSVWCWEFICLVNGVCRFVVLVD